jgi:hypothetical protein
MNKDKIIEILRNTDPMKFKTWGEFYNYTATEILNSIETLDRDKVENIIDEYLRNTPLENTYTRSVVDAICKLAIPDKIFDKNKVTINLPTIPETEVVKILQEENSMLKKELLRERRYKTLEEK